MWKAKTALALTTATAAMLMGQHALAQESDTSAEQAERGDEFDSNVIIVRARRVEESQQDVPIAVSTVTADRLEEAAVTSVEDVERLVPSLRVTEGATAQLDFTIRGSFLGFGVDPSVLSYLDEVPVTPKTMLYNVYDVESVEVLKGPQGTLFGKNSTGGAVLFTSKRPSLDSVEGNLTMRYGNYNEMFVDGAINVPLTDTLAVRFASKLQRRDGYLISATQPGLEYGNRDNTAAKLSVLFKPSDTVENVTFLSIYRTDENRAYQRALTLETACTGPTTPGFACAYQPPFTTILGTDDLMAWFEQEQEYRDAGSNLTVGNYPNLDAVKQDAIQNNLTLDFGNIGIKNIVYFADRSEESSKDWDATPATIVEAFGGDETDVFYTETQVFGTAFNDVLDWRIGGVYAQEKADDRSQQTTFPPLLSTPRLNINDTNFKTTALFGTVSADLSGLVDGLTATVGYRYTWDNRKVVTQSYLVNSGTCALQTLPIPMTGPEPFPDTDLATCTRSLSAKFENDSYNFSLDWKATDSLLLYLATRKGYKSGSFNISTIDPLLATYAPERVTDYEIGLKADWQVGTVPVRTNIALFQADYTNIQTSFTVVDPSGGIAAVTVNQDPTSGLSSKARIKGVEVEFLVSPTSWLDLSGFYSRIDGKYSQFIDINSGENIAGEDIANITPTSWGLTGNLDLPLGGSATSLVGTLSYFWRDALTSNSQSAVTSRPPEKYGQLDGRIGLKNINDTGIDVSLYGRNMTDSEVCTVNTLVSGLVTDDCNEGFTYGIELRYRFGD